MKIGTFFSGIGSPEQALKNLMLDGMEYKNKPLEIDIEFGCEIDKYAKQTYLDNFRPKNFYDDITKLDMKKIPYVDLLIAGFPCQAFSIAGNRLGFEDVRGTLFFDLLRYIKTQQPKYFILENVKGLLSHDKGKTFDVILKCLAKTLNNQLSLFKYSDAINYNVHYQVLNTKHYGLPQNRERIFIIGIREDVENNFRFPKKIPLKLKLKDMLQDNPDSKYYLKDDVIKRLEIRDDNNINCLTGTEHDSLIWIADYRTDEGLRIRKNNISPCLNASGNPPLIKKNRIRRLTPLECFRLQGFPDDFKKSVSDTQLYKQAGNTISVPVIESIILNLIK